jgi:hypothetical protein
MAKDTKYESEATQFLKNMLNEKPELELKRRKLRNTWWDKAAKQVAEDVNLEHDNLPVNGYQYFSYDNISKNPH